MYALDSALVLKNLQSLCERLSHKFNNQGSHVFCSCFQCVLFLFLFESLKCMTHLSPRKVGASEKLLVADDVFTQRSCKP